MFNENSSALIRTEVLEETKRNELLAALQTKVGDYDKTTLKEDKVGPAMGQELTRNAFMALIIAMG